MADLSEIRQSLLDTRAAAERFLGWTRSFPLRLPPGVKLPGRLHAHEIWAQFGDIQVHARAMVDAINTELGRLTFSELEPSQEPGPDEQPET